MKSIKALLFVFVFTLTLTACSSKKEEAQSDAPTGWSEGGETVSGEGEVSEKADEEGVEEKSSEEAEGSTEKAEG